MQPAASNSSIATGSGPEDASRAAALAADGSSHRRAEVAVTASAAERQLHSKTAWTWRPARVRAAVAGSSHLVAITAAGWGDMQATAAAAALATTAAVPASQHGHSSNSSSMSITAM